MVQVGVHESILDQVRLLVGAHAAAHAAGGVELVGFDSQAGGADLSTIDAALRSDLGAAAFRRLLDEGSAIRWLHSSGAGVEKWPLDELARRGVTVTNAAGVFAVPIAEWVLATMLNIVQRTEAVRAAQSRAEWNRAVTRDELFGSCLLILGAGGIARHIISRAGAFGMTIWVSNRRGQPVAGAATTVAGDGWRELLPHADFVVSTLPLTPQTTRLIGAEELRLFKPGAWLLNVGRGATIDEPALFDALRAGTLGGAALDVWTTEPLPAQSPAWSLPNVIVSPHISGDSAAARARGLELFADNVVRFATGQPLTNVVDPSAGY